MPTYSLCKRIIERGTYNFNDMKKKLDAFLLADSISVDEYNELVGLMGVQQTA
ncbi:hypothetical protein M670_00418 [Schinkia azotoformans MEV2011]|uniref:XkdX family protein n=1 Tax=Schinkia azotoformans MEV2011 TaxID=1348973 RepID=A0A072NT34_SCHAZ|nr:hypothetical protein [Schinkia azotoformans]KEF40392.1 hypothetical protein M670_00418 [Schinkia azotoformans MEV2011]MEC1696197.1 hypothetical protein [Schinkia azotoformans]MEC1725300.1 hypothetical protein [Schinkia azotoformans]